MKIRLRHAYGLIRPKHELITHMYWSTKPTHRLVNVQMD